MARLINILKEGFKKNLPVIEQPGREKAMFRPLSSSADPLPVSDEVPVKNPYTRKAVVPGQGSGVSEDTGSVENSQDIYRPLFAVVRLALSGTFSRERTEELLVRIAEEFERDLYCSLLLMTYSFSKKNYLAAHITNDVVLAIAFARSLGYDRKEIVEIGLCAFVHDLGMSNFSEKNRQGHSLLPGEIDDIKGHPLRSAEIANTFFNEKVALIVADVHERENGQGYPRGIAGTQIHLWAKIVAVCDTFEALTHPRVFRAAYSPYEALKMIIKKADVLFDREIVKCFINFLSIYPVGTLVSLNSGEIALVTGANAGLPARPVVRVLVNERREVEEDVLIVDLSAKDFVYISGSLEQEKEKEILYFLKPRGQVDCDEL